MYEFADRCFKSLLKDLLEIRKRSYFSGVESQLEVESEVDNRFESNEDVASQAIHGIKTKATIGHPKRRLKGSLESRTKTTLTSSCISDLQQHACGARQVQSPECFSKVRYVTLLYNTRIYKSINIFWFMLIIS
jgi:hypothetical protein